MILWLWYRFVHCWVTQCSSNTWLSLCNVISSSKCIITLGLWTWRQITHAINSYLGILFFNEITQLVVLFSMILSRPQQPADMISFPDYLVVYSEGPRDWSVIALLPLVVGMRVRWGVRLCSSSLTGAGVYRSLMPPRADVHPRYCGLLILFPSERPYFWKASLGFIAIPFRSPTLLSH